MCWVYYLQSWLFRDKDGQCYSRSKKGVKFHKKLRNKGMIDHRSYIRSLSMQNLSLEKKISQLLN